MTVEAVRIRVRIGTNEVEIEAPQASLGDVINLIPEVIQKLPEEAEPKGRRTAVLPQQDARPAPEYEARQPALANLPEIRVEKDDSLADVITKLFREPWGRKPRRLGDVRVVLESYGLIYPKQSVAVALLRLAQSGRLRRFKGEEGDFVYTASTALSAGVSPKQAQEKVNAPEMPTGESVTGAVVA